MRVTSEPPGTRYCVGCRRPHPLTPDHWLTDKHGTIVETMRCRVAFKGELPTPQRQHAQIVAYLSTYGPRSDRRRSNADG